jgi:hypothetical protein
MLEMYETTPEVKAEYDKGNVVPVVFSAELAKIS